MPFQGDNVWKAAGPGVLQTADNGIAASSVTPTNLVRPSLSDGSSLEYVRHRFDKHAISERCGGAVRHQGQMSSRGGGGLAASANASGKPHSLLSLPHQGHQQQRWQAGSSSNNAAVGGPRGLMPLPGHAGLTSSYSAPQQFVPSMASGHSGVAAATYANPGAMGNGGYATPVGMASPTPSHNSGRAGLNATSHSNTGGKGKRERETPVCLLKCVGVCVACTASSALTGLHSSLATSVHGVCVFLGFISHAVCALCACVFNLAVISLVFQIIINAAAERAIVEARTALITVLVVAAPTCRTAATPAPPVITTVQCHRLPHPHPRRLLARQQQQLVSSQVEIALLMLPPVLAAPWLGPLPAI